MESPGAYFQFAQSHVPEKKPSSVTRTLTPLQASWLVTSSISIPALVIRLAIPAQSAALTSYIVSDLKCTCRLVVLSNTRELEEHIPIACSVESIHAFKRSVVLAVYF